MNQNTHILPHAKQRILSMLLLLVMLASSFTVNADAGTAQRARIQKVKSVEDIIREDFGEMLDLFNLDQEEKLTADTVTLLKPVNFYLRGEEISGKDRIVHLPVMDDTKTIRCIYSIVFTEAGWSTSISTGFAPLLNAAYQSFGQNVTLLQDGYSLYAITSTGSLHQICGQVISLDKVEDTTLRTTFHTALTPKMQSARMDESVESSITTSFEVHPAYTNIAKESIQAVVPRDSLQSATVTGKKDLKKYPIVSQFFDGKDQLCCWAAAIASMLRFERPSQYGSITPKKICDDMKISYSAGATLEQVKDTLAHYLPSHYLPTIYNKTLTVKQIKAVIDNNDPAWMGCQRRYGILGLLQEGHAVALCGYDIAPGNIRVRVMDSAHNDLRWCNYKNGDWVLSFGSASFTWKSTVRLLYKSTG